MIEEYIRSHIERPRHWAFYVFIIVMTGITIVEFSIHFLLDNIDLLKDQLGL
jgi:hypothetical protein